MKNVLITGATGGIGTALTDLFHKKKYNLLVSGTNQAKLESLKTKYIDNIEICKCNLSKRKII